MLETLIEYLPFLEGLWTYLVISNTIFFGVIVLLFILGRLQPDIETYYTAADMRPKLKQDVEFIERQYAKMYSKFNQE